MSGMEEVKNFTEGEDGHLIASKDLEAGDVIVCVPPISAGPGWGLEPVCLGCNTTPQKDHHKSSVGLSACSVCSWPVCCVQCQSSSYHQEECQILKGVKFEPSKLSERTDNLDVIHVLRTILAINKNNNLKKELMSVDIDQAAILASIHSKYGQQADVKIRSRLASLNVNITEPELSTVVCLVERMSVPMDCGARGLHAPTLRLEHSCSPNTYFIGLHTGWVVFRACSQIKLGEKITMSLVPLDTCNYFRRKLLQERGVHCKCQRCMDGSEFGTGFGGVACSGCKGYLHHEKDLAAPWVCSSCQETRPSSKCEAILEKLNQTMKQAKSDPKVGTPDFFEDVLKREGEWAQLPPNSQIFLDARKALAYIYQYHPQYYFPKIDFLKRKQAHCAEWIKITDLLYPGRGYDKTLIQYEAVCATTSLIQAMKEEGCPREEVNKVCQEVIQMSNASCNMMIQEEDQSMHKAFIQMRLIATEAREEQKTRVYLNMYADDEEEGW